MGVLARGFCLCGAAFLVLIYLIIYLDAGNSYGKLSILLEEGDEGPGGVVDTKIVVLVWTSGWGGPFSFLSTANQACPRCHFTHDQTQFSKSAALVFLANSIKRNDVPQRVDVDQVWLFMILEPPDPKGLQGPPKYDFIYNWTITYRRNSDVRAPYGEFIHVNHLPRPESNDVIIPAIDDFHNRSMVAWINSHCETVSRREEVVKGLQRHIPVDIYGGCGPLKCPTPRAQSVGDDCRRHIMKTYKFYLAFENNLCSEYATEKFFDTCKTEMIPVVYGGSDYAALFPPKSFINARDFETVKQLSEHLKLIGSSPQIWLEYFEYRKEYWVRDNLKNNFGFCELCHKLAHRADSGDESRKRVNNVTTYWSFDAKDEDGKEMCQQPTQVPIFANLKL